MYSEGDQVWYDLPSSMIDINNSHGLALTVDMKEYIEEKTNGIR